MLEKTHYELLGIRKLNIAYFHGFGSSSYILNTKDQISQIWLQVRKKYISRLHLYIHGLYNV